MPKERPGDPALDRTMHAARVGRTPEAQLAWLVSVAPRDRSTLTEGDLLNLAPQMALAFDLVEIPDRRTTLQMLDVARDGLLRALAREDVLVDARVQWDAERGRFQLGLRGLTNRLDWHVTAVLSGWLIAAGHLLRVCPAPAPRSDRLCERLFVQARPQQAFCSSTCQSRANVRVYRKRTAAPRPKRRRKRPA